jgi:hypothetical protein
MTTSDLPSTSGEWVATTRVEDRSTERLPEARALSTTQAATAESRAERGSSRRTIGGGGRGRGRDGEKEEDEERSLTLTLLFFSSSSCCKST